MAKKKAKKAPKKSKPKKVAKRTVKGKANPSRTRVAKKKAKSAGSKRPKRSATLKTKTPVKAKRKPGKAKRKAAVEKVPPVIEQVLPGEDLKLIPKAGDVHPVGLEEAKRVEHFVHHHQEVAFRQENQKIKQALAIRKGSKPIFRNRGRGS